MALDFEKIKESARRVFSIEARSVAELESRLTDDFARSVAAVLDCKGRVVVCGMGKSGIIGKKIAATLASTGTPSFFMHPGEALHGDLGMVRPEDIFLGLSNSGETEEMLRLIPALRRTGNLFIALCGRPASTMVRHADFFLNSGVDEEACPLQLAPTSSTTAALALGDALAVALMETRGFRADDFALFHPGGSLGRKLLTKVSDVMRTDNLPFTDEKTGIRELILKISEGKLGMAMVTKNGRLVGVVTDGDLRRAWNSLASLEGKTAGELMNGSPKTVSPDIPLAQAETYFTTHKITSLIVSRDETVEGVLQIYAVQ